MIFYPKKRKNNIFSFYNDDENHIIKVLRKNINDEIFCIDENTKYRTKIISINPLLVEIIDTLIDEKQTPINVTLFQSIIKDKNFEWIVTKSAELQVMNFAPIICERSQSNRIIEQSKLSNWIKSANKQSNRLIPMNLLETNKFTKFIDYFKRLNYLIVPHIEKNNNLNCYLGNLLNNLNIDNNCHIGILIGPEGGFSKNEIETLMQLKNCHLVKLTETILRSETASVFTISVIIDYLMNKKN